MKHQKLNQLDINITLCINIINNNKSDSNILYMCISLVWIEKAAYACDADKLLGWGAMIGPGP